MLAWADRVVVITGAASGIGRATAIMLAGRQAKLSLCARDAHSLVAAADECRALGADVVTCVVDITKADDIENCRSLTVSAFGHIDVWINCAAILSFGRFEDIPAQTFRRVVETNILGYANGARTALTQFTNQGECGTLINVGSLLGIIGEPFASPYVTTKFAIRGLTACLRQEAKDRPGINICTVLPWAIDTPIYQKAANVSGKKIRSIFPVYAPERVAQAILGLIERPRREVIVGGVGHLVRLAERLAPGMLESIVGRMAPKLQFQTESELPIEGNSVHSRGPYTVSGGWRAYWAARFRWSRKPSDRSPGEPFPKYLWRRSARL